MRQKLNILFILLAAIQMPVFTYAQTVKAKVNTGKITIGDPVYVFLEVAPKSEQQQVLWPVFPDSIHGLEWIDIGKIDTINSKDSFLFRQKLALTGFDSGVYVVPSFSFQFQNTPQSVETLKTDSFLIDVATVAVDTTKDFKPIHDIIEVKTSWLDHWKIILAVLLGLAILVFLIIYLIKKRKSKETEESDKVPPEQAFDRAYRLLNDLNNKKLWQNGNVKGYYDELSIIIRNYIENRFEIPAMELTTDELMKLAKKEKSLKKIRPELKRILQTSDLAKYAKAEPLATEQETCLENAFLIIQKTKLKEKEVDER